MARARYNTQNQGSNFSADELQLKDTLEKLNSINLSAREFRDYLNNIKNQGVSVNQEFYKLNKQLIGLDSDAQDLYNILKGIGVELGNDNQYYKEGVKAFNNLTTIAAKLRDNTKGNLDLNEKDLKKLQQKVEINKEILTDSEGIIRELEAKENNGTISEKELKLLGEIRGAKQFINMQSGESLDLYQALTDEIRNQLHYQQQIGKTLGVSGGIIKGMTDIFQRLGLTQFTGIDELNDELKISAEHIIKNKKSFGQLRIAGQAIKGVFKEVYSQMGDPLIKGAAWAYAFKELIQYTFKTDENVTKLAKSLVISKNETWDIRGNFREIANSLHDGFTTSNDLIKANIEVGKQLGFNKVFSKDINTEWINITQKMGLSQEAAGFFTKSAIAMGIPLKNIKEDTEQTIQNIGAEAGIRLDIGDTLEEISKTSGQILSNYQGNPIALAKAVSQIKLMGSSLEQTQKQGNYLLDFQSSLQSELKAELLLGKSINLEKARAAALTGDYSTIQKELTNQSLDFNEFSKLNIIQQNALAESLGLSSDELSKQLMYIKYQGMAREKVVALAGEEIAQNVEALSLQDKFNKTVEKLKELLVGIFAGPIGKAIEGIITFLSSPIGGVIATTAMGAFMGSIIGPWGTALGGAAGLIGGIAAVNANDAIIPAGQGNKMILSPEGAIKLNDKDSIIAGTDLFNNKSSNNTYKSVELGNDNQYYKEGVKAFNNLTTIAAKLRDNTKGNLDLNEKDLKKLQQKVAIEINLNPLFNNKSSNNTYKSTEINLNPLLMAINSLRDDIKVLITKQPIIEMDSRRVGSILVQGTNKSA